VNVAVRVHEAPARIVVQSFVWLNSEGFKPVMLMSLITRSDVPVFFTVRDFPDVTANFTFPKLTDIGETEILGGGAMPKSFTLTVGLAGALEETLIVALLLPKDIGSNVPVNVHELPADIVAQSFVWLNSEAFEPIMSIMLIARSDVPVFLIVIVFCEVPPTFTLPKLADIGVIDIRGEPV